MRSAEALSCSSASPSARSCLLHPENVLELPPTPDFKQKSQVQSLFPRWKSFWRQGGWRLAPHPPLPLTRGEWGQRPGKFLESSAARGSPELTLRQLAGRVVRSEGREDLGSAPPLLDISETRSGEYMGKGRWEKKSLLFCNFFFFFFAVIFNPSEFFACCWLQDHEPSTLHQFNKWWNHSSLETKALRTQQCKYNQVCGCLFSVFFKVYWNFQLSDFSLLASWGCDCKWGFAFEGSFFGHTSGALSLK